MVLCLSALVAFAFLMEKRLDALEEKNKRYGIDVDIKFSGGKAIRILGDTTHTKSLRCNFLRRWSVDGISSTVGCSVSCSFLVALGERRAFWSG